MDGAIPDRVHPVPYRRRRASSVLDLRPGAVQLISEDNSSSLPHRRVALVRASYTVITSSSPHRCCCLLVFRIFAVALKRKILPTFSQLPPGYSLKECLAVARDGDEVSSIFGISSDQCKYIESGNALLVTLLSLQVIFLQRQFIDGVIFLFFFFLVTIK